LNWIVQNKFIAFAGPHFTKSISREGCYSLTPQAFIPYFKEKNVGLVVRLNKRMYNEQDFQKEGIKHFERFYTDGSCPTVPMLRTILHAFEQVPDDKGIAVHCKAGLGRTGTCIGAYIMKHYNFTAKEVIGWMRICRPGMVIGPQQHFLEDIEKQMWYEGQVMKMRPTREPTAAWSDHNEKIDVSDIQEQSADDRQEGHLYDQTSEAVQGRAGQADALLSARRSRRT
jgi:cell division cycle 14